MKKIQLVLFLFIAGFMSVNAQVRIGSDENPHEGSILDLTNSKNRGLKLPTVSLQNAEILQVGGSAADEDLTAVGMVVYNTNTYALYGKGLYVWDGYKWNAMSAEDETLRIATCLPDYYAPDKTKKVTITVKNTLKDNTADPLYGKYAGAESIKLTFLTYNLGANPNLTPKQQMAYVSTLTNKTYTDITVSGGLYQWGRSDVAHSFRCDYDDDLTTYHSDLFTQDLYTSETLSAADKFVWGEDLYHYSYDWYSPHTDASTHWGNGKGFTDQTQTPSSNTNNPCPSGFRVPTQHEWALLGSEGGSSTSADDDSFYTSDGTSGTTSTSGLVWIPVKNGVPSTDWTSGTSDGTSNYPDLSGYALYTSDTWNGIANKTSLIDPEDPEPLMFLPAAGSRNYGYGRMYSAGDYGNYWSSTVGSISYYGQQVGFNSNYVNMTYGNYRTVGMSVRCISE